MSPYIAGNRIVYKAVFAQSTTASGLDSLARLTTIHTCHTQGRYRSIGTWKPIPLFRDECVESMNIAAGLMLRSIKISNRFGGLPEPLRISLRSWHPLCYSFKRGGSCEDIRPETKQTYEAWHIIWDHILSPDIGSGPKVSHPSHLKTGQSGVPFDTPSAVVSEEYSLNHLPPDEPGESYERYQKQTPTRPKGDRKLSQHSQPRVFVDFSDQNERDRKRLDRWCKEYGSNHYLVMNYYKHLMHAHPTFKTRLEILELLDRQTRILFGRSRDQDVTAEQKQRRHAEYEPFDNPDREEDVMVKWFKQYERTHYVIMNHYQHRIQDSPRFACLDIIDFLHRQRKILAPTEDEDITAEKKQNKDAACKPRNPASLSGHYARDFPEEFSHRWMDRTNHEFVTEGDKYQSAKLETALDRSHKQEPFLHTEKMAGTTDPTSIKLDQTVIDDSDGSSKKADNFKNSSAEDCAGKSDEPPQVRYSGCGVAKDDAAPSTTEARTESSDSAAESAYMRDPEIDGVPPSSSEDSSTGPGVPRKQPTVYKILAYDPTVQKVSMVETTSVLDDHATPLTPGEALLRISNPAKFCPYFAPLQSEGFEVISGRGDVLVFRKVRAGWPSAASSDNNSGRVNPIDMMGSSHGSSSTVPNAAAFASPTGFINYELPQEVAEEAANTTAPLLSSSPSPSSPQQQPSSSTTTSQRFPPYNIHVRREEPVFSGPKEQQSSPLAAAALRRKQRFRRLTAAAPRGWGGWLRQQDDDDLVGSSGLYDGHNNKKKKNSGKKNSSRKFVLRRILIGGIWVAVVTYSGRFVLGYFTTTTTTT